MLTALLRRFEGVFPQNYQTGLGIRKSFHLKLYEFRAELSMAEKFKLGADLYDDGISWMKQIIKAAMSLEKLPQDPVTCKKTGHGTGFVANGYSNLMAGVDSEARRIVEAKYADEWNTACLVRRWKLQRVMNTEIKELTGNLMPDVSSEAMF